MTQLTTLEIGARRIEIHSFSGEVVSSRQWTTTEISGGGGHGVISQGSGYVEHEPVKSKTTTHEKINVLSSDGDEESLEVADTDLAIRDGHWVSLLYAIRSGEKKGPYIAIFNHHMNTMTFIDAAMDKACMPFVAGLIGAVVLLFAVLGIVFAMFAKSFVVGVLAIAPCAAYFIWLHRRRGEFRDKVGALRDEVKARETAPALAAVSPAG